MNTWRIAYPGLVVVLVVAACGGSTTGSRSEPDGATGGSATTADGGRPGSGGRSAAGAGTAGSGGRGATGGASMGGGGAPGTGGAAGGAHDGGAPEGGGVADGPPAADAGPPAVLFVASGWVLPEEHVTLAVEASQFIGGIDRWIFSLTWSYDDPASDDEESRLTVRLPLMLLSADPIGTEPATYSITDGVPESPLEHVSGTYFSWGMSQEETPVTGLSGHITVWRDGGRFVGSVHLELVPAVGNSVHLLAAGPFDVPVP